MATEEMIQTADGGKLDIKFIGRVDIRTVYTDSSTDSLLQQQEQCSDSSDAVYHSLPHTVYTYTPRHMALTHRSTFVIACCKNGNYN